MRRIRRLAPTAVLVTVLLAGATACDESNPVVVDIGTTQLLVLDTHNAGQSLYDTGDSIQDVVWRVKQAQLTLPDQTLDLRANETCEFFDTPFVTGGIGSCARPLVVSSFADAVPVTLSLTFELEVSRAVPSTVFIQGYDFDDDGIADYRTPVAGVNPCRPGDDFSQCDDNCPKIANPDQADANLDGFGDACTIGGSAGASVDSDGDGVADLIDNCLLIENPGQENTTGPAAEGVRDGVGDACPGQTVSVVDRNTMSTDITVSRTFDVVQARNAGTVLTVAFDTTGVCDWDASPPTCSIDPAQIVFCAQANSILATLGCP